MFPSHTQDATLDEAGGLLLLVTLSIPYSAARHSSRTTGQASFPAPACVSRGNGCQARLCQASSSHALVALGPHHVQRLRREQIAHVRVLRRPVKVGGRGEREHERKVAVIDAVYDVVRNERPLAAQPALGLGEAVHGRGRQHERARAKPGVCGKSCRQPGVACGEAGRRRSDPRRACVEEKAVAAPTVCVHQAGQPDIGGLLDSQHVRHGRREHGHQTVAQRVLRDTAARQSCE